MYTCVQVGPDKSKIKPKRAKMEQRYRTYAAAVISFNVNRLQNVFCLRQILHTSRYTLFCRLGKRISTSSQPKYNTWKLQGTLFHSLNKDAQRWWISLPRGANSRTHISGSMVGLLFSGPQNVVLGPLTGRTWLLTNV